MENVKVWRLGTALAVVLLLNAAWETFAVLHSLPRRLQDVQADAMFSKGDYTNIVIFFATELFSLLGYWASAIFVLLASQRLGERPVGSDAAGSVPNTGNGSPSGLPRAGTTAGKPRHRMPSPPAA